MSDEAASDDAPPNAAERAELDRLKEQAASTEGGTPRRRVSWRSVLSAVLIVLGAVLAPISVIAIWSNNQVSDTDRFVRTVSPLLDEPSVQSAVTDRVTNAIVGAVDLQQLADQAVDALAGSRLQLAQQLHGLTGPLVNGIQGFVHDQVGKIVASPQFASVWDQVLRVAHNQMVGVLSGDNSAVAVQGDMAVLDLGPFVDAAKQQLVNAGLGIASAIPTLHPTIPLFQADTLVRAQNGYSLLNTTAAILPWVSLLLLAVGVFVAHNRRRAVVGAGLGLAGGMLVLGIGLLIANNIVVNQVPAQGAVAANASFDVLVRFLRDGLRAVLVVALIVALAAFLAGPSPSAVWVRGVVSRSINWLHRGGVTDGPHIAPVAAWVRAHRMMLRIVAIAVAALVLVFLEQPSGVSVLVIAVILLVVLAVIEFLGQRPPAVATAADHAGASPP